MNFGDCPYCNDFIGMFEVPDRTPAYAIVQCESCKKDVWYKFSRIDPMSWTIEDFEKEFIIDKENNKIIERNPKQKITLPKELLDEYARRFMDYILNGESKGIEPIGILNSKDLTQERGYNYDRNQNNL